MKSIYQLTALIGNKSDGINDEKFMTAAWILYAWMRREVIDCIPLPELPATVSKSAKTGRSVASIYQPEEHFFTLRSSVFENGIRDTVEAEIMPKSASCGPGDRFSPGARRQSEARVRTAGICAPTDR